MILEKDTALGQATNWLERTAWGLRLCVLFTVSVFLCSSQLFQHLQSSSQSLKNFISGCWE